MNLTGQSLKYGKDHWVAEIGISASVDQREVQHLRKRNNLLQVEVLLNKFWDPCQIPNNEGTGRTEECQSEKEIKSSEMFI